MRKSLTLSYLSIVGAFVAFVIIYGCSGLINSFQNQFFERDPALSYFDKNGDQVPGSLLSNITYPISFGVVILFSAFSVKYEAMEFDLWKKKLIVLFSFSLGLGSAILANQSATTIIKRVVGRPRPDAFFLCNYKGYADAVNSGNYTTYNLLTSVNTEGHVSNCYSSYEDAWQSFPSGHASQSFVTMVFATMLLRSMFQVSDNNFISLENLPAFGPVVIATWISLTRLTDNKHHVDDVLGGAIIGTVCALFAYFTIDQWLLSVSKKGSDEEDEVEEDLVSHRQVSDRKHEMVRNGDGGV